MADHTQALAAAPCSQRSRRDAARRDQPRHRAGRGVAGGQFRQDRHDPGLPRRTPKTTNTPDPEGPVQPLDGPEATGDPATQITIDGQGVTISGQVQGVPLDVRVDQGGVAIQPSPAASPTPASSPAPQP